MEGIEATVMNIREALMGYYKGTCVDTLTTSGNIRLVKDYRISGRQHLYERRELELADKNILLIGDLKIFTLTHNPNKLVFYSVLDRSPQLLEVKKGIEAFVDEFLMGVEKVYITKPKADVTKLVDDTELVSQTRIRTTEEQKQHNQYLSYEQMITRITPLQMRRPSAMWSTSITTNGWTPEEPVF